MLIVHHQEFYQIKGLKNKILQIRKDIYSLLREEYLEMMKMLEAFNSLQVSMGKSLNFGE